MFDGLIGGTLASLIGEATNEENITELRLRAGHCVVVETLSNRFALKQHGLNVVASRADIDKILEIASHKSMYAVGDEMKKGYIPYGKYRIGIAGEGVSENGKLLNVKNISSIVVRVPHQIKNAADEIAAEVLKKPFSTLMISPPGAGKTTILRELARLASKAFNVVVIDERYEISAFSDGNCRLDVGEADVVVGIPKTLAYENCVRALNPQIIVTDEIFRSEEIQAVCDIVRSGVKVFASVHGDSIDKLNNDQTFANLLCAFDFAVVLSKEPKAGTIVEKRRLNG